MNKRGWSDTYNPHKRCVLLDRDGVINRRIPRGYVTSWEQFEFLPRALEALLLLKDAGYAVLVISNQACVGKGLLASHQLDSITKRFLIEVALSGGNISQVYYCTHVAKDHCNCRKPRPGLLLRARIEHGFLPEATYFVGDTRDDVLAAADVGCRPILVGNELSLQAFSIAEERPLLASSLFEAVEMITTIQSSVESRLRVPAAV
jgi:D-glycero-D-manno-heptose 1,7-bisphosphate phosphatase